MLPQSDGEKLAGLISDEHTALQNFFLVKDWSDETRMIPLRYNSAQRYMLDHGSVAPESSTGGIFQKQNGQLAKFLWILKARKVGVSTYAIARALWRCATRKSQHAIILTHTGDAADKIVSDRIKPMLDRCLYPLQGKIVGDTVRFDAMGSTLYVGTAGSKSFGRGDDITHYHLTEFAHWPDDKVLAGVEEACVPGAEGIIETTANGNNFAKISWDKAKRGESKYLPVFLAWWVDERYRIPGEHLVYIGEGERDLMQEFGLSEEQIAWMRRKKSEMNSPELFPQEYPSREDEAFLGSGRMIFDWRMLNEHERMSSNPQWTGRLADSGGRIEFRNDAGGNLRIWRQPENGHRYIIGADVAEGIEGGAYSTGEVLDLHTMEQVAEWHGHISPDLLADELAMIGVYYNDAVIAPESYPGPGAVTMQKLLDIKYRNIYRGLDGRDGWRTDERSKRDMIIHLAAGVRESRLKINSKDTLSECRSYVYNSKQHMVPQAGCYSDRLIGLAIAYRVGADLPLPTPMRFRDQIYGHQGGVTVPQYQHIPGRRDA